MQPSAFVCARKRFSQKVFASRRARSHSGSVVMKLAGGESCSPWDHSHLHRCAPGTGIVARLTRCWKIYRPGKKWKNTQAPPKIELSLSGLWRRAWTISQLRREPLENSMLFEKRRAVTLGGIIGERFYCRQCHWTPLIIISLYIYILLGLLQFQFGLLWLLIESTLLRSGALFFFCINSSATITTVPILRPRAVFNFCAMWRIVHFSSNCHGEAVRAWLDRWQALVHPRDIACRSTAYATRSPRQLCRMHKSKWIIGLKSV